MVMDQFVTTYRKDYLWPYIKTLGLRPEPQYLYEPNVRGQEQCSCHNVGQPIPTSEQRQLMGPPAHKEEAWSRLGPMGPLLDPKMYPAKVSASPESQVSRYNQPNVFLEKLQQKYPFIYECLKSAPPDDLLSRINRDRLRSTYQVDFCRLMEYPSAPYDELIRAAGLQGSNTCPEPVRLPGDIHRPLRKAPIPRRFSGGKPCSVISKGDEVKNCVGTCRGPLASVTTGATEYQDAVSRLGMFIIRDKIHDASRKKK